MSHTLTIDRFEGDEKQIAVLVSDDKQTLNVPRALLPADAQAGDVLTLTFKRDIAATRKVAAETRAVQAELKKTDPGGDIAL